MSRPRQFDETEAIEGAMIIFWKRGFAGTNMPDLLDAMSLTRGSFYKAFEDKHSVYLRALDHYDQTRMARALSEMGDKRNGTARDRLLAFFLRTEYHPAKPARKVGCFLCNALVEMAPFDTTCATRCADISTRLHQALMSVLYEMMPEGDPAPIKRKATALQRLYLGSHAMGRMGASFDEWSQMLDEIV
ncbi:TetR/AcrR family transcriptional regulator [Falsiruegeria mediterranea]|uniref:HTH-type transcriptional repressor ComR n=1 Tax=Falsiruegeria mediterranea M17 TaxID=1200281 RepID=A0A2R8CB77_9RHOB|nr:TetR/AcrR family transcriptional regulator [Falsiruegeria mediterranea]SPJ29671.1 HTH-type transcriptional repressor ComR [Falsiruegeria mediterranea M17]